VQLFDVISLGLKRLRHTHSAAYFSQRLLFNVLQTFGKNIVTFFTFSTFFMSRDENENFPTPATWESVKKLITCSLDRMNFEFMYYQKVVFLQGEP